MATINRPVSRSVISTSQWGIPITDQVNQNTTDLAATNAKITPTAWTGVTFQNGWSNFGGGYQAAQYRKVNDIVYARGTVRGGAVQSTIFTLPTGFRPPATTGFPTTVFTTARQIALLLVFADGQVQVFDYTGNVDLNTIQFSISAT